MSGEMNAETPAFLLCTNGNPATRPAIEYGVWLAQSLGVAVFLLGVVESLQCVESVDRMLLEAIDQLKAAGVPYEVDKDRGRGSVVIARWASSGRYITVVGRLGRPTWRRVVQGRSFRRLLEKIETPILYVPQVRQPLAHILLCSGGLEYSSGIEQLSQWVARWAGARITLLHVVEPIEMDYPTARQIQAHWKDILQTNTPQGRNLQQILRQAHQAGVEMDFKVRHGSAVHEILEEVHGGGYDLVALGSSYSTRNLRHLYMPNVTAEVAENIACPVLTARRGYALV